MRKWGKERPSPWPKSPSWLVVALGCKYSHSGSRVHAHNHSTVLPLQLVNFSTISYSSKESQTLHSEDYGWLKPSKKVVFRFPQMAENAFPYWFMTLLKPYQSANLISLMHLRIFPNQRNSTYAPDFWHSLTQIIFPAEHEDSSGYLQRSVKSFYFFFLASFFLKNHSILTLLECSWFTVCVNYHCTARWLSYTHMYSSSFLFHYDLSQDIEYSSLWYTKDLGVYLSYI